MAESGRRDGLKIRCPSGRVGSIPTFGIEAAARKRGSDRVDGSGVGLRAVGMRFLVPVLVALWMSSAASAARPPDPCALLTNAQVTKAIGYKVALHSSGPGLTPFYRSCTWSGPAIGFTQSRPSLMLQTSRLSKARFLEGAQGHVLIAGLGGPGYELMDGNIVLAWRDGVALMFELVQAQTTPKSTLVVVSQALAKL